MTAYVAGWRCRRLKLEKQARQLREAELRAQREQLLARQKEEEEQRRRKAEAQEALDAHVSAAVKDLREEAVKLRQTARSISTENELLHFSLQQKDSKVEELKARLKEKDDKIDRMQAEALQASLAAHRQQEMLRFDDLRRQASSSSNMPPHSQAPSNQKHLEGEDAPAPTHMAAHEHGGGGARADRPDRTYTASQPAAKAHFSSVEASAAASVSPWAHEKRIARDIQHHKQVRACEGHVRACLMSGSLTAACLPGHSRVCVSTPKSGAWRA